MNARYTKPYTDFVFKKPYSNIIIYSGANENSWLRELFYESNSI